MASVDQEGQWGLLLSTLVGHAGGHRDRETCRGRGIEGEASHSLAINLRPASFLSRVLSLPCLLHCLLAVSLIRDTEIQH